MIVPCTRQVFGSVKAVPRCSGRFVSSRCLLGESQMGIGQRQLVTRSLSVQPQTQFNTFVPQNWGLGFAFSMKRFYSTSAAPKVVPVPPLADSITEGRILEWKKKEGEQALLDQIVVILETDKVRFEIRAPSNGTVTKHLAAEGDDVAVGQGLFEFTAGEVSVQAPPPPKQAQAQAPPPSAEAPAPKKADAPPPPPPKAAPQPAAPAPASQAPAQTGSRDEKRVKMTKMRERIAQRLKDSQNTAAMLTTFNEIDMHNIIELRNKYKDVFEKKHGAKLGFMSAFVRAASIALREHPVVNAVIDGEHVIYRDYHDISVAVSTPTGLVVPVLRNVEKMSFADIEKAINDYAIKARDNKIAVEDMAGGTFTISNGGVYGSLFGTPIINPPQSAILGMHAINKRAHVVKDEIKIRPIMFVALTYDHRLIDGRDAVLFLKKIKSCIEEPDSMLLDV